jgi:DNA polymerase III epsilon subunit-like protein
MGKLRDLRALYLDLELECWSTPSPYEPRILQIGMVEADLASLTITRERCFYVRPPHVEVSPFCTELTGITDADLQRYGRPLEDTVRTILKAWGPRNKITFTWGDDETAIARELPEHPFHCINYGHLFSMTHGIKGGLSLARALDSVQLMFPGREHNALIDAKATCLLHLEMVRRARKNGPVIQDRRPV